MVLARRATTAVVRSVAAARGWGTHSGSAGGPLSPFSWVSRPTFLARAATSASSSPPRVALLIVGDEVLRGSVADANTQWAAQLVASRGADLVRVEMVPDDMEDVADSLRALRRRVGATGLVLTSGGVGEWDAARPRACRGSLRPTLHRTAHPPPHQARPTTTSPTQPWRCLSAPRAASSSTRPHERECLSTTVRADSN